MLGIAVIILRVSAILLLGYALSIILVSLRWYGEFPELEKYIYISMYGVATYTIVAALLWVFAKNIARNITKDLPDALSLPKDAEIVAGGMFVVGIYLLSSNVYVFISQLFLLHDCKFDCGGMELGTYILGAKTITGLLLILGYRFFCSLYLAIKRFGS